MDDWPPPQERTAALDLCPPETNPVSNMLQEWFQKQETRTSKYKHIQTQITGNMAHCSQRLWSNVKEIAAIFNIKPLQSSPFSKSARSGFKSSGRYNGSYTICKISKFLSSALQQEENMSHLACNMNSLQLHSLNLMQNFHESFFLQR